MTTKNRVALASLLLLALANVGCSGQDPAAEVAATPPAVSAGPAVESSAPTVELSAPTVDPTVRPASADVNVLGDLNADVNQVVKQADADASDLSGEAKQVKENARRMIERARRSAAEKVEGAEAEVKKDGREIKDEVVKDLIGDPK